MRSRNDSIDFIKGVLIFGVVFGHALTIMLSGRDYPTVPIHVFIRTYDMPLFMLMSGFFLRKSVSRCGAIKVVLNRITTTVVPLVVWTFMRRSLDVFGSLYYFLWAVFASTIIIVLIQKCALFIDEKCRKMVEISLCILTGILLHAIECPWNLFYLFPFFALGYFLPKIPVRLGENANYVAITLLIVGLCYWKVEYTPWNLNGLAWRHTCWAVCIYIYRFVLSLLSAYVMMFLLTVVYSDLGNQNKLINFFVSVGKETLPLYLIHMIPLGILKRLIYSDFLNNFTDKIDANIISYLIAPFCSFVIVAALLFITKKLRTIRFLRALLIGFKLNISYDKK